MKIKKEKWHVLEHSWSETSIYNEDNEIICTLSIDDEETTEENQEEREKIVSERFLLISKAPEMLEIIKDLLIDIEEITTPTSMNETIIKARKIIKESTEL